MERRTGIGKVKVDVLHLLDGLEVIQHTVDDESSVEREGLLVPGVGSSKRLVPCLGEDGFVDGFL